jgi:CRP/FNR family cyclic AMP-dependent transcriptional regulator
MMNRWLRENFRSVLGIPTYRRGMTIPRTATRTSPTSELDVVEILRSATIFADLPDDVLARLAAHCVRRSYRRNQYLWYQGDDGAHLVVVASGLVKVVLSSPQGGEVVLTTLGPGEISGELAVLDGSPRSASVVAAEPTTVVMLSRATVLELLNRYPSVLDAVLRALGDLIRRLTEQAGDFVFLDLGGRVAKLLLHLAEAHGAGSTVLDLGLTQSDLAAMVGATRPAVNRVLQQLAARGVIKVDGQRIVLLNVAELRRRAST